MIAGAILVSALSAFAASLSSPLESNPTFGALLASLLGSESLSDDQKLQRLDGFFSILQTSFDPHTALPVVRSLSEYLALRNEAYSSTEIAYQAYLKKGLVTPLSVRASTPQVMEAIMTFEAEAAKNFLAASRQQLKPEDGILNIQAPILEMLPDLYLGGKNFRDNLAQTSGDMIRQSFEKAEELRQRGNPAGIASWFLGAGLSVARATGEALVNPLADKVMYGEFLQNQMRAKILGEISKLRNWPREKKLGLIHQIETTMQSALSHQIQEATQQSKLNRLARGLPLATVIRDRVLPEYFSNLRPQQRAAMIWTVFNTPHFNRLKEAQQMQLIIGSLGPVLPFWLRQMSRLPNLKGTDLSALLCCQEIKNLDGPQTEAIRQEFLQSTRFTDLQSVKVDPRPLAMSPLKDTFLITATDARGEHRYVFQRLRPDLQETLKPDLEVLTKLQSQTDLMSQLAEAGAPQSREMIGALIEGVRQEADLKATAEQQRRAREAYHQVVERKLGGRRIQIEIEVAKTVETFSDQNEILVQEYASGESISEARKKFAPQVAAALDSFGEIYMKAALMGDAGFIWSEPREDNMRIEVLDGGEKIKLTLLNFGSAYNLTRDELQKFYSAIGQISILEMIKLGSGTSQIQDSLKLVTKVIEGGLPINLKTMKFALGFLHLRGLLGAESFNKQLVRVAMKQPALVWSVLGPRFKMKLQEIYDTSIGRIRSLLTDSAKSIPSRSSKGLPPGKALCSSVHSH